MVFFGLKYLITIKDLRLLKAYRLLVKRQLFFKGVFIVLFVEIDPNGGRPCLCPRFACNSKIKVGELIVLWIRQAVCFLRLLLICKISFPISYIFAVNRKAVFNNFNLESATINCTKNNRTWYNKEKRGKKSCQNKNKKQSILPWSYSMVGLLWSQSVS